MLLNKGMVKLLTLCSVLLYTAKTLEAIYLLLIHSMNCRLITFPYKGVTEWCDILSAPKYVLQESQEKSRKRFLPFSTNWKTSD